MIKTFYTNGAKVTLIIDFSESRKQTPLQRSATARMIFLDIEREYGYSSNSLLGYTRTAPLVKARDDLWFRLKKAGFTPNEIAEFCNRATNGGNGSSTIHYGIKRHKLRTQHHATT